MVLDENHSQLEMIMRIIINIKKEMIMRIIINIKKVMKMKMRIIINSWAKERALSSTPGGLTVCFSSSMELKAVLSFWRNKGKGWKEADYYRLQPRLMTNFSQAFPYMLKNK
jgi:hypothetical protein